MIVEDINVIIIRLWLDPTGVTQLEYHCPNNEDANLYFISTGTEVPSIVLDLKLSLYIC